MSDEQRIGELLKAATPPDSAEALERTAAAARVAARSPAPTGTRLKRPRLVLAGCAVIALVGFSLTPPGRAIAEGVAELVGIGDSPTVDHDAQGGPIEPTTDEIVIGSGSTADGVPFEIVAYEGRRSEAAQHQLERQSEQSVRIEERTGAGAGAMPPQILDQDIGTCVSLDWPQKANPRGGDFCIDGAQLNPLPIPGTTDAQDDLGPGAQIVVTGVTGPEVDRVSLLYTDNTGDRVEAPVTLAKLEGELAELAGTEEEFGFYVAFLPDEDVGEGSPAAYFADVMTTVELVAYGSEGEEIKRLDYGRVVEDAIARQEALQQEITEAQRAAERAAENAPLSEADCPVIAEALREAGRPADSLEFHGWSCPSSDYLRTMLANNPGLRTLTEPAR